MSLPFQTIYEILHVLTSCNYVAISRLLFLIMMLAAFRLFGID